MRWKTIPVKQKLPKIHYERLECEAFHNYVKHFHPNIYPDLDRHECGGSRGKVERFQLAKEGLKRGFPDFAIYYPAGPYHGLFIEMKKSKKDGGKKSDVKPWQKERIERLIMRGYSAHICFGAEDAINALRTYLLA